MAIAKFEIRRKCLVCGEPFKAKTIESWYCTSRCSKIAYKRRKDEEKRHDKLDAIVKNIPESKEYIKVTEAYALFGISKDTLYRLIRKGRIPYINAGKKMIRVSRNALIKMYPLRIHPLRKKEENERKLYSLEPMDCYTINELCEKYHMNESTAYLQIRKYSIPTRQIGNYVYVPKKEIDNLYKSDV